MTARRPSGERVTSWRASRARACRTPQQPQRPGDRAAWRSDDPGEPYRAESASPAVDGRVSPGVPGWGSEGCLVGVVAMTTTGANGPSRGAANGNATEQFAYTIDAFRRQEQMYRRSGLPIPAGVAELVSEIGFRVTLGQAGSLSSDARDSTEDVERLEPIAVRYETAAQLLEVSVSTIKRLVRAKTLPAVQIGPGAARIRVADLHDYLTSQIESGADE